MKVLFAIFVTAFIGTDDVRGDLLRFKLNILIREKLYTTCYIYLVCLLSKCRPQTISCCRINNTQKLSCPFSRVPEINGDGNSHSDEKHVGQYLPHSICIPAYKPWFRRLCLGKRLLPARQRTQQNAAQDYIWQSLPKRCLDRVTYRQNAGGMH